MIGAGCSVYQEARLNMPDPAGLTREFLEWFNLLDLRMLEVCKKGS